MKPISRSILGVALFIPLAALLLATFACLPVPVGDPEQAKIDDALVGGWRRMPTDAADKGMSVVLLRPWDTHTYLLQYVDVETKEDKESRQMVPMKAWLTTIGGATFLCAQPMDDLRYIIGDDGQKPYWVVIRLDKTAAGIDIRMVQPDSTFVKGLTKREEVEAAIKAHVNDDALYGNTTSFKKLTKDDVALLETLMAKFNTK